MGWTMKKGSSVVALQRFEEQGFNGPGVHVHAEPGDVGEIVDVFDLGFMVRWARTGTACDAFGREIQLADQPPAPETISA